jgi:hypothetical protein
VVWLEIEYSGKGLRRFLKFSDASSIVNYGTFNKTVALQESGQRIPDVGVPVSGDTLTDNPIGCPSFLLVGSQGCNYLIENRPVPLPKREGGRISANLIYCKKIEKRYIKRGK